MRRTGVLNTSGRPALSTMARARSMRSTMLAERRERAEWSSRTGAPEILKPVIVSCGLKEERVEEEAVMVTL